MYRTVPSCWLAGGQGEVGQDWKESASPASREPWWLIYCKMKFDAGDLGNDVPYRSDELDGYLAAFVHFRATWWVSDIRALSSDCSHQREERQQSRCELDCHVSLG